MYYLSMVHACLDLEVKVGKPTSHLPPGEVLDLELVKKNVHFSYH